MNEISGLVPQNYTYDLNDERLDCEIKSHSGGELKVILNTGNTHSAQRINSRGGTVNLIYDGGSISSSTSSSSSGQRSSGSSSSTISGTPS